MKKLMFLLASVVLFNAGLKSQSLISLKSYSTNGTTDTVDNAPIIVDVTNKVVVSGNKKINGSQYDATTAQELSNGIMTWTASFNLSSQKCWVTSSTSDASGNIYVTGGVATGTANGVDLFVLKYKNTGTLLWSYTYNGPGSALDVGTGICLDGSNDVYVCGASDGTMTALTDFVTIKLKGSSGSQQWVSRYNYSNSYDAATGIVFNSSTSYVEVSGPSGTTYTDWDIATVAYKYSDGSQQWVNRAANPGGNEDKAYSMATDTLGNVYVAGTSWNAGNSSYDVSLQKLDTALNMVWIKFFDGGYNLDDAGLNVALDDSLNIYVAATGYYKDSTLSNLILLKYDKNGNYKKKAIRRPSMTGSSAEGIRVKVKNMNEIFVGGNYVSGNNQDIAILRFDSTLKLTLETKYNGALNGKDKFLDFAIRTDSNFVYVSGRTDAGGGLDSNIVLTYRYDDFPTSVVTVSDVPSRTGNELLVRFQPSALRWDKINDVNNIHGTLSEFLTTTALTSLDSVFSTPVDNFPCYKIFPFLTLADTVMTTRAGNSLRVSDFWATFAVILPSGGSDTLFYNTFWSKANVVNMVDFNLIGINNASANDPQYTNGNSAGLVTTTVYPNANINVEPAWDLSVGNPSVIVGVFDTGINFTHQDFGNGTFAGSKITNGRDYTTGGQGTSLDMVNSNDPMGHGSAVAGIIGAIRNNNFGVAGIAGGDATNSNTGISLNDMKTSTTYTQYCYGAHTLGNLLQGMWQGAKGPLSPNAFFQDVQNHSYSFLQQRASMLYDMYSNVFQTEVVLSVSSGNADDKNFPCNNISFPASYPDRWLLRVGSNDSLSDKSGFSECGRDVDILAPGERYLYQSLDKTGNGLTDWMTFGTCSLSIDGTSFSAPHAAGVAALMLSYINTTPGVPNTLYPEDIEEVLQLAATDINSTTTSPYLPQFPYTTGYDQYTGSGRLNAGQALQSIKYPDYMVKHYQSSVTVSTSAVLTASNEVTCLINNYLGVPQGTCLVDKYKVTTVASHTIPTGYSFIKGWELDAVGMFTGDESASYVTNCTYCCELPNHTLPTAPNISSTITANSATLVGYVFKLKHPNLPGGQSWFPAYFPNLAGTGVFSYALYLQKITGLHEHVLNDNSILLYPNPASDKVIIKGTRDGAQKVKVEVYNVIGQLVMAIPMLDISQENSIDISSLKNGVYLFNLTDGTTKVVKKVIINH